MSPLDRRLFTHLNWSLLILALLIFALGVMNLYSASSLRFEDGVTTVFFYKKQILWGALGLCVMIICMSFDYRHLKSFAWPLLVLTTLLLIWVLLWGQEVCGSRRWIDLLFFSFQPSELAKLSVLLITAVYFSRTSSMVGWNNLAKLLFFIFIPIALIILQPDLGSGLNILLIVTGMIIYKGLKKDVFITLALSVPLFTPLCWFFLEKYQKQRILSFLNPYTDPLGAGYNTIQSQIAIGSGRIWGKGFLEGTQSQLRFLPEKHTDFVFAVFGEEWGFAGCSILLILFCLLLYQIVLVIQSSKDEFGKYIVVGIFFYFFWQILINMSMVLGLMPIVGMPLPFLSYGGTSTVLNFCFLGLILNVSMRRYVFKNNI